VFEASKEKNELCMEKLDGCSSLSSIEYIVKDYVESIKENISSLATKLVGKFQSVFVHLFV